MKLRPDFADKRRCSICGAPARQLGYTDVDVTGGEPTFRFISKAQRISSHERDRDAYPVDFDEDLGDKAGRSKRKTRWYVDYTHECARFEGMDGHPYNPGDPLSYPNGCGALTYGLTRDTTSFPRWCYADEDGAHAVSPVVHEMAEQVTP